MRSSMEAQSWASVPPAPAWISRKQGFGSWGLLNMRRNSRAATLASMASLSAATAATVSKSPSSRAISNSSLPSARPWATSCRVTTTPSRAFFSRPRSWARLASSQTSGLSSSRETST